MNEEDFIGCHDGKGDDNICLGIRIGKKQGALEELKGLLYVCKHTCNEKFISIRTIKGRIKELENNVKAKK